MEQTTPVMPCAPPESLAGPGSVAWKINSEVVLLLGWGRAILLQFAHPLVAAGVAEHSLFIARPTARFRRLHQTLRAMLALTFGTSDEAARAAYGINAIHDHVRGQLREAAGAYPAGTSYSAHDPALLRWVHATLLDTFPRIYELYIGPLTPEERERYCAEASGLGPLLGVPEGYLPTSTAAVQDYMHEMFAGGQLTVTGTARALAREVVSPPSLWLAQPLLWLMQLSTIGLLPPAIREAYGFRWTSRHETALRLSVGLVRRLLPLLPSILRYWPPARVAFKRSRG